VIFVLDSTRLLDPVLSALLSGLICQEGVHDSSSVNPIFFFQNGNVMKTIALVETKTKIKLVKGYSQLDKE
jgi:hypothetical protein